MNLKVLKFLPIVTSILLFGIFIVSLFQKLSNYNSFKSTLIGTGFFYIGSVEYFAITVIILEFIIAYLLLSFRKIGFIISSTLLAVYIIYIGLLKLFYFYPTCGCGGILAQLPFSQHLFVNIILFMLSAFSIIVLKYSKK